MPSLLPITSEPVITCYTKAAWADAWVQKPLLQAMSITDQAAPGHSSATLCYRYGIGMLPAIGTRKADRALTPIPRGSLIGNYVRIVVNGLGTWFGIIIDNADGRIGTSNGVPMGMEQYTAFGLSWFLDQSKPITKSKVKQQGGEYEVNRAIPFNGGTDGRKRGNRLSAANYDPTTKVFTDRTISTDVALWTAANAIEYLIAKFPPKNSAGSTLLPFALHSSALTFLNYELPMVAYDGLPLWQIFNRIIDRRRGLGWHTVVESNAIKIVVWSQNQTPITLATGGTIPANANQASYNFDGAINIRNADVSTTLMTRWDQVLCRGERAGTVFTVRPQSNMEPDWVTADQTKYNTAASAQTGYSVLSDADKEAANNDRRAADDLSKVFSWWRLRKDWNGRSDTDPSTGTAAYALPLIDSYGAVDTTKRAPIMRGGLRFETFLPMRPHVDYSVGALTKATGNSDTDESDFLPPFVLFKLPSIRSGDDAGWVHAERINAANSSSSSKRPHKYSVDLAVREDAPGIMMRVVGEPQHYICKELYTPNSSFEAIASGEGINSDDWLATVYVLQDQFCRGQHPHDDDLPALDLVRQLTLDVPDAHFDVIPPGTIVGVSAGTLKKTALGGTLRDDRDKLTDLARLAFEWYGKDRRILNLSFRSLVSGFSVGNLITTIGSGDTLETINTCITSISYDLRGGTTSLHTNFGELDFVGASL